jgi:CMP-N-acetylneuraminic acid synthetase
MSGSSTVAVIPVREGSQRVQKKNFRPFSEGENLLERKINQVVEAGCFDEIYVSSDSARARGIAEKAGVVFLERASYLCSSSVRWPEVIRNVAMSVPGDPVLAWVHVTSPFFSDFAGAVRTFCDRRDAFDSLVTVRKTHEFFVKENRRPLNYSWGHWHEYSQELDPLYRVTGSLFIAQKADMIDWSYVIGTRPYLHEVSIVEALDIDTMDDFAYCQLVLLGLQCQLAAQSQIQS